MVFRVTFWLFAAVACGPIFAADASVAAAKKLPQGFIERVHRDESGEHRYLVFVPARYSAKTDWPVILYLHGASERGTDERRHLRVGLGPFVKEQARTFPFLVVFPQSEDVGGRARAGWDADSADGRRALAILDAVEREYRVDPRRRIITGWSMGGYGAWSLAAAHPDRFAAVVTISGGGDPALAERLKAVPVWAFHGEDDAAVPPSESRALIDAVKEAGGRGRFTLVPRNDHEAWKHVYGVPSLYDWLRRPATPFPAEAPFLAAPVIQPDEPFVPAVEVSGALAVRLGSEALKALASTAHELVEPEMLTGSIPDIYDTTVTSGRPFNVCFTCIRYGGRLVRTDARCQTKRGCLNVVVGLRDMRLTIGRTYVTGKGRSAVAGPMSIVIGSQRPVWLGMDLKPYVKDGRVRLKHVATQFRVPPDDFYVTPPAGVSTRGWFMTRKRVSSGLVEGLYDSRDRIEREVSTVVPTFVA
ncbi:MAG: prolyl oligopeptidase family serine peptidase, partial [Planctomycetes bacterium]|nr:prolyl oligopeptidase family serine peptidase [Planctomycetota bacterium]